MRLGPWRIRQSSWGGRLLCNAGLSWCDGCKWGKQHHACLTASSKDDTTPAYPNTHTWHLILSPHASQVTSSKLLRNIIRNTLYEGKRQGEQCLVLSKDTLGGNLVFCINSLIAERTCSAESIWNQQLEVWAASLCLLKQKGRNCSRQTLPLLGSKETCRAAPVQWHMQRYSIEWARLLCFERTEV